jgi:hypothetical protein
MAEKIKALSAEAIASAAHHRLPCPPGVVALDQRHHPRRTSSRCSPTRAAT